MLPHKSAMLLPPAPDPHSRQQDPMSPPPQVRRRLNTYGSGAVEWSLRMQVQESQLVSPFRLNRTRVKQLLLQSTSKSSSVAHKAVSVARVAAGIPVLPTAGVSSSQGFELAVCGRAPEDAAVTLYKLLDKLDKHCLDFATMLKFFEFFGWDSDDGRNKHNAWIYDWHDILKLLGILPDTTPSLRIDQFIQLVQHPDRPPLLQEYTVDQMLYHVRQSYLAGHLVSPPPLWNDFPLAEAEGFATWYIDGYQTRPLIWHLTDTVEKNPAASSMLLPGGVLFMYWYYMIFGESLNEYFGNWCQLREINRHPIGPPPTSSPFSNVIPSSMPTPVYETIRVCWLWYKDEKYLFLNLMDKEQSFFRDLKWLVTETGRMGVYAAEAECWDGDAQEQFPDCICTSQWRGLKSMVYASNKKNRFRGIMAAIYLHALLKHPRESSIMNVTDFDRLVLSWLEVMHLSPTTVYFHANTFEGPGHQLLQLE